MGWLEALSKVLSAEEVALARTEEAQGRSGAEFLLQRGKVTPARLLEELSIFHRLPAVSLRLYEPDPQALTLLSYEVARRFQILPLFVLEDELYLGTHRPDDLEAQDFVRQLAGLAVHPVVALASDLEEAIGRAYLGKGQSAEAIGAMVDRASSPRAQSPTAPVHIEDQEAPAIKLVNYIFTQAVRLGASDVHLEPFSRKALLRYRIDGILHEFPPPPPHLVKALISRIKVISNMDTSERRLPQDGRTTIQVDEGTYDLRVSTIPGMHGEGVVVRVLDPSASDRRLEDLGFAPEMRTRFEALLRKPHGIILVTGPTGAGKTTTLYASLRHIHTLKRKFLTLEDPVEYQLEGVTQTQVNPEIGLTFANGLRAILRQDPDVVMVGEIRDLDSAEIAMRAALTGHLLLSSLHTNDSALAVTRLIDIGVQPYLVLTSLAGVLAQRLLRRLCPQCKVSTEPTAPQLASLGLHYVPAHTPFYEPAGCKACGNLGYRGRIGVYELLEICPEMRKLPPDRLNASLLRQMAVDRGFVSLRESALQMLFSGVTSVEEVVNVTAEE